MRTEWQTTTRCSQFADYCSSSVQKGVVPSTAPAEGTGSEAGCVAVFLPGISQFVALLVGRPEGDALLATFQL